MVGSVRNEALVLRFDENGSKYIWVEILNLMYHVCTWEVMVKVGVVYRRQMRLEIRG